MTEATARPWRVEKAPMSSTPCIFGGDGFETWICGKFTNEIEADIYGPANAFLIVKAVNHHDALVSALEEIFAMTSDDIDELVNINCGGDSTIGEAVELLLSKTKARSILSQVRGE